MKRILTSLLIVSTLCLGFMPVAQAGYCEVENTRDSSTDTGSFRAKVEQFVNRGAASTCVTAWTDSGSGEYIYANDYKHFVQGIIFETPERGGAVRKITMSASKGAITFDVLTRDSYGTKISYDLVVGNYSQATITDSANELATDTDLDGEIVGASDPIAWDKGFTSYGYSEDYVQQLIDEVWDNAEDGVHNFGTVIIDAREVADRPFKCKDADSGNVYLRDMVILTSTFTQDDVFADDSEQAFCIKNAGNVHVCTKDGLDEEAFNAWVDAGASNGTELKSNWCKDSSGSNDDDDKPWKDFNPTPFFPAFDCERVTWYADTDGDGYGDENNTVERCYQPDGYTDNWDDCDDTNAAIHPYAEEICGDGLDNNCDGLSDCEDGTCAESDACTDPVVTPEADCDNGADDDSDGATDCYDTDCSTDAACAEDDSTETSCTNGVDDDGDSNVDCEDSDCALDSACTGVDTESECEDSIDNDEDGLVDCEDADCSGNAACSETDADGDGYTPSENDCDDTDPEINPAATEYCADGIDNNCDGDTDQIGACVDLDPLPPGGGYQLEGSSGCTCNIHPGSAGGNTATWLGLLGSIPFLMTVSLRRRAKQNDAQA